MKNKRLQAYNNWIFNSWKVTAGGLGLFRIFASLFILFFLIPGNGIGHFSFLASLPDDFYAPPPGIMQIFGGFPSLLFFKAVLFFLSLSLILMALGWQTKKISVLAGILILILQGFIFSIGKINHELLIGVLPILMAFTNWGAAWSLDARKAETGTNVESWPLTLLALFVGFMMFTAGFPKILGGWLDISTQAVQGHLFNQYFMRGRTALLAEWFVNLDNALFWEILDWATVIFEVGFLIAVCKPKWFRMFAGLAVVFHFSTMIMLNIAFIPNFLIYSAFLSWPKIEKQFRNIIQKIAGKGNTISPFKAGFGFFVAVAMVFGLLRRAGSLEMFLAETDLFLYEVCIVICGLIITLGVAVHAFFGRKRKAPG